MNKSQFKKINKETIQNNNILTETKNTPIKETKDAKIKYEVIKELPTWSIEPPFEIKRGNQ